MRIQRSDTVLEEDSHEVGIGNEIAASGNTIRYMAVGFKEAVQLGDGSYMSCTSSADTLPSASDGDNGTEKMPGWVEMRRYDISVGHAKQSSSGPFGARFEELPSTSVPLVRAIRRIEKHIHIERIAHDRSASRAR